MKFKLSPSFSCFASLEAYGPFVMLRNGGVEFKVHEFVLFAQSEFVRRMIAYDSQKKEIDLNRFSTNSVKDLIGLLYHGEVESNSPDFVEMCHYLQLGCIPEEKAILRMHRYKEYESILPDHCELHKIFKKEKDTLRPTIQHRVWHEFEIKKDGDFLVIKSGEEEWYRLQTLCNAVGYAFHMGLVWYYGGNVIYWTNLADGSTGKSDKRPIDAIVSCFESNCVVRSDSSFYIVSVNGSLTFESPSLGYMRDGTSSIQQCRNQLWIYSEDSILMLDMKMKQLVYMEEATNFSLAVNKDTVVGFCANNEIFNLKAEKEAMKVTHFTRENFY